MIRTITLVGARGGHGTSTVAATIAIDLAGHDPVRLLTHDPVAMAQLLGVPMPLAGGDPVAVTPGLTLAGLDGPREPVTVIDAGLATDARPLEDGERYAVVRGPCYLALATLVSLPGLRLDGVILIAEPGRSLHAADVSAVLDLPVVASVPHHPSVGRVIDAGLLAVEAPHLPQLQSISKLAMRGERDERSLSASSAEPIWDRPEGVSIRRSTETRPTPGWEVAS